MHHSLRPPLPDLKSQKHQNSLLFPDKNLLDKMADRIDKIIGLLHFAVYTSSTLMDASR